MKNYNHYDLNPPKTIVNLADISPEDEIIRDAVDKHLYEQRHAKIKNEEFLYLENAIIELINNESDQTV